MIPTAKGIAGDEIDAVVDVEKGAVLTRGAEVA